LTIFESLVDKTQDKDNNKYRTQTSMTTSNTEQQIQLNVLIQNKADIIISISSNVP